TSRPSFDQRRDRSIFGGDRSAEAIVDACGYEINVLADPVGTEEGAGRVRERDQAILHEEVIIFDGDGPTRRKAEFDAGANRPTPAGVPACGGRLHATKINMEPVGRHGGAALHVDQHVVPGVAELPGEEAKRI